MSYAEAIRLTRILRGDPSSQLAAAIEGWDYPLGRDGFMLADLLDIQGGKALGKKWKTYPRPMKAQQSSSRVGDAAGQSPEQVKERLRLMALGHADRLPI